MVLVSTPLNGRNYMAWSRAMRIALGAKMKLGFITGKCVRPDENSDDFEKWMRVDCMVTSWLLNSISKDIVDAFLYTASAHDLWTELEQRFGECNGPLLYQIQREIASISQGNEGAAMFTRAGAYKKDGQNKSDFKKRNFVDKKNLRCDNCNRSGHDRSTCFKIHGIPDWYKDLTEQRKKDGTGGRVFNVQTSDNRAETEAHSTSDATSVSEIVRMELMKFMRGLAPAEQQPETRSDEYAGINFTCSKLENLQLGSWIIATNHMCANSSLFHSLTLLKKPVSIRLPDNSSKTVTQSGTICLNDKISLAHVLYVPFFHNNLISVSKLCVDSNIALEFLPTHCILQDRMTEEVLAVARQTNRLYILDPSSFSRNLIDMHCSKLSCKVFHVAHGDVFLCIRD
ncbi:UNVERIFIED_CONTAM: hypothetical protein Sradi_5118100 [Sesamum radiatum]|uniref:Retrotransposon Copia-like N-terminal domain-containing protein n=1 Tax=Sesamum radiatum TaxID=300843 RepID=A0AAW2M3C4_SESRA